MKPRQVVVTFTERGAAWRCTSPDLPDFDGQGETINAAWDAAMARLLTTMVDRVVSEHAAKRKP